MTKITSFIFLPFATLVFTASVFAFSSRSSSFHPIATYSSFPTHSSQSFQYLHVPTSCHSHCFDENNIDDDNLMIETINNRRSFLARTLTSSSLLLPLSSNAASTPVQRAVGSAESNCRLNNNCLETFELDGAVGWNWGGTERCAAGDTMCGPDGKLRDEPLKGKPVPSLSVNNGETTLEITNVVVVTLQIGSGSNAEIQSLKVGLYGNQCPKLTSQFLSLCTNGIVTSKDLLLGAPVKLGNECGLLTYIRPEQRLEFGIPSQKVAYAKSIRKAKAPDEFVPQSRPGGRVLDEIRGEKSARNHDAAGLVSVPKDGIGYGDVGGLLSVGTRSDDEAYASAFQITADAVPEMDGKEGRKVIGQLMDGESMSVLARLAGSPLRKIVPGQNGGSPLIKVVVLDCSAFEVGGVQSGLGSAGSE
mmetsp:Transcript_21799/g.43210  ORF Transcript_21799/g.43210 Transcript_21799/m.43210 type:complete len:418 (+) Transcript_21799:43-1296(+)